MKSLLILIGLGTACQLALAQEHLPRKDALKIAFVISADLKQLQGTPIASDVDIKHVVAMREGDYGALAFPETKLTADTIAKAKGEVVPVGQLWLRRLTPIRDGEPVGSEKLRLVDIDTGQATESAVQCALGVKANASGDPELLVYGKDKAPLVTVPMKKIEGNKDVPIAMDAVQNESEAGQITLKFVGRYAATIKVTELAP